MIITREEFDAVNDSLRKEPLSHASLLLLGFKCHPIVRFYCPPPPAHGGTYRLDFIKKTEKWEAYLPYGGDQEHTFIRYLNTLGELSDFHKGMCGKELISSR